MTLDRWHAAPGDQIPAFMERTVRENDFVIAVCTPRFKGSYEGDIMTAYAFTGKDKRKFIPVLRRGSWSEAAPTWLLGRAKIDLSGDPYSDSEYEELLRTLHGAGRSTANRAPSELRGQEGVAGKSSSRAGNHAFSSGDVCLLSQGGGPPGLAPPPRLHLP